VVALRDRCCGQALSPKEEGMRSSRGIVGAVLALCLIPAGATAVSFTFEGTTPDTGIDVLFTADLTIAGDTLTLVLTNDSLNHSNGPSPSLNPNDVLSSFYFAIAGSPTLTWTSGTGDVYLGDKDNLDSLVQANQDLTAGASRWDFIQGVTGLQPGTTVLSYGIGAAGNNTLEVCCGAGFDGSATDGVDLGIYAGDVTTPNLQVNLVKTTATFTFSGLTGFSDSDISAEALFGLGTQPDSTGFVPEPSTGLLMGMGMVGMAASRRRRR
jgi:hypothetical protein